MRWVGYGVVVYDWRQGESWRITHHYFHMDPLDGDYNVGNVQFHWTDGIFSLALGSRDETGYRPVSYFAICLSSNDFTSKRKKKVLNSINSKFHRKYMNLIIPITITGICS